MKQLIVESFEVVADDTTIKSMIDVWDRVGLIELGSWYLKEMTKEDWMDLKDEIELYRAVKNTRSWTYRDSFWKEKHLSRLRVGVHSTRVWAKRVGLSSTDSCRYCKRERETLHHIFMDKCMGLEHRFDLFAKFGILEVDMLRHVLLNEENEIREDVEEHILQVIGQTKVFATMPSQPT